MVGLDTNVLLRYIVQDDEQQGALATQLIEAFTRDSPGFVSLVVLCELVWVLRRPYKLERQHVVEILRDLLDIAEIRVEKLDLARGALQHFITGTADYSDYLLALVHRQYGAEITYTFDRAAAKEPMFRLLAVE